MQLHGLQDPGELPSIPTAITNVTVSFMSLHKLLRCWKAPALLASR